MIFVILMYAGWSSMFSLGKIALTYSPPLFLTGTRMLLAGLLLISYLLIKNKKMLRFSLKQWGSLGILAFFSIYLTNALEFYSLQHLSAAKTCFIYSLSPFFSALFSYFHFKEKLTLKKWAGMAIGFVGILPVLSIQKGSGELFSQLLHLSWPEIAMIGASIATVYGWVLLRILVKDTSLTPFAVNGISMLFGGGLALIHSFFVDSWSPLPVQAESFGPFFGSLFAMTLISNIICYNIYASMLKKYTATFLSFMGVLSPIFASVISWIFLSEALSPVIFLSTGVVSFGLWLIYSEELKQGYIQTKAPAQSS